MSRSRTAGAARTTWVLAVLLALGASVIAVALLRGQSVDHVVIEPGKLGVDFGAARGSGLSQDDLAKEQATIRDRVTQLEAQVSAAAPSQAAESTVDLTGQWLGANGLLYVIQQGNGGAVIQELSGPYVTAAGQGAVSGRTATFEVVAVNGVSTQVQLTLEGADTLRGTFSSTAFGVAPAVMTRR